MTLNGKKIVDLSLLLHDNNMVIIGMDSNVGLRGRNQGLPNRASYSEIADENNPNAVSRALALPH